MGRYIDADKLCKDLTDMARYQEPYKQSTILGVVSTIENRRDDVECDRLNKNGLWVSHDVFERIVKNPDGIIFHAMGEAPILVTWHPVEKEHNLLAHPESYLDDTMAIVDDMTMAQRIELLKYLEESIEKNKRPRVSNSCEAMCMED